MLVNGTPSTTYKGEFEPFNEVVPRTRTVGLAPG